MRGRIPSAACPEEMDTRVRREPMNKSGKYNQALFLTKQQPINRKNYLTNEK